MIVVTLPWPPRDLSPNERVHYMRLYRAKKAYKEACMWAAKAAGVKAIAADRLHLVVEFVPPSRRAHDLDNCIASSKAGFDGLAKVLGVDDSRWTLEPSIASEIGGFVRITVHNVRVEPHSAAGKDVT